MGGAHLASPSGAAAAGGGPRKGPKRPQPLAPFSKFANAPGPVQPWEGGLVVLDGSSALAPSVGAVNASSSSGGWAPAHSSEVQASEASHPAAVAAGSSGSAANDADALREENEQLRVQLAQATSLAASWGKLNGQLQTFCTNVLLQGGTR